MQLFDCSPGVAHRKGSTFVLDGQIFILLPMKFELGSFYLQFAVCLCDSSFLGVHEDFCMGYVTFEIVLSGNRVNIWKRILLISVRCCLLFACMIALSFGCASCCLPLRSFCVGCLGGFMPKVLPGSPYISPLAYTPAYVTGLTTPPTHYYGYAQNVCIIFIFVMALFLFFRRFVH